jgi:hypothetical protein
VVNNAHFRVEPEYVKLPATEPDAIYQGIIIRVRPCTSVAQVPRKDHFDRHI